MRIIKNPNPVEEIVKECESCSCTFAFTEGDVKTYAYSNEVLGPGYYGYRKRYVLCPNCGKEIIIEEKSTDGRDSMIDPMITIDFEKLMKDGEETIQDITSLGPDIEELTLFPHLENPEEDGE
jgi:DNA-directed RNA polymerase subunit RPC12/RpoP